MVKVQFWVGRPAQSYWSTQSPARAEAVVDVEALAGLLVDGGEGARAAGVEVPVLVGPYESPTVLVRDQEGRIVKAVVQHRPLSGLLAFSAELGRRLKGQVDDDLFHRLAD
ncbi:hypothetical protein [Kitasatospora griseola]|uniref:hypothetical protein n=1 Tax=Kitasatospora griseola TaxID=2064 RepID=UPI00381F3D7B